MASQKKRRHDITPERREQFLDALRDAKSITEACRIADISRSGVYQVREADKDFAAAWDDAYEAGTDKLREAVIKRATTGKRPSDILLMFELKRRDPSYRESFKHEVGGPNGGPIPVQMVELVPVEPK